MFLHNNPSPLFQIAGNAFMLTPLHLLISNGQRVINKLFGILSYVQLGLNLLQFLQSILGSMFEIGLGRSSDIDDVILNTMGAVVGVGCYFYG